MKIMVFLLAFILAGCSTVCAPIKVPVPVSPPSIKLPPNPKLEISNITTNSPPDVVAKAYVATIYQLLTINDGLRSMLEVINGA